ncbi:MAG: SDR family NAD(P)-dependent oxidoreductase [Hyphomicrobiaceae bacterium]
MTDNRLALVTGGNRGLGFAACEKLAGAGYDVALTARDQGKADAAAGKLAAGGVTVEGFALDVLDTANVREAVRKVYERFGRIDVLINNAGIYPERDRYTGDGRPAQNLATDPDMILATLDANTVGPYRVLQAVLPIMREQGYGRIVNVSSQMARLSEMNDGSPGYRISKTAVNGLTALVAAELAGEANIKVNAADPGWVRTDMGGEAADRNIDEGVDTIVWLAMLEDDGPTGGFFRDRQATAW